MAWAWLYLRIFYGSVFLFLFMGMSEWVWVRDGMVFVVGILTCMGSDTPKAGGNLVYTAFASGPGTLQGLGLGSLSAETFTLPLGYYIIIVFCISCFGSLCCWVRHEWWVFYECCVPFRDRESVRRGGGM